VVHHNACCPGGTDRRNLLTREQYRNTLAQSHRPPSVSDSNVDTDLDSVAESADSEERVQAAGPSEVMTVQNAEGMVHIGSDKSSSHKDDPHDPMMYPGLYAPSGFDMLSILVCHPLLNALGSRKLVPPLALTTDLSLSSTKLTVSLLDSSHVSSQTHHKHWHDRLLMCSRALRGTQT
jgi:hypothetical protein